MAAVRGFVGQGMDGRKAQLASVVYPIPLFATSVTLRDTGAYRIVLWGAGGFGDGALGSGAGASGAYIEVVRQLHAGDVIAVSTGQALSGDGLASTVTLPGEVLSAGGGKSSASGGAAGVASVTGRGSNASDILLNGSAPGVAGLGDAGGAPGTINGGGGAPGRGPHRGADGQAPSAITIGSTPGGGGAFSGGSQGHGGSGLILFEYLG